MNTTDTLTTEAKVNIRLRLARIEVRNGYISTDRRVPGEAKLWFEAIQRAARQMAEEARDLGWSTADVDAMLRVVANRGAEMVTEAILAEVPHTLGDLEQAFEELTIRDE